MYISIDLSASQDEIDLRTIIPRLHFFFFFSSYSWSPWTIAAISRSALGAPEALQQLVRTDSCLRKAQINNRVGTHPRTQTEILIKDKAAAGTPVSGCTKALLHVQRTRTYLL